MMPAAAIDSALVWNRLQAVADEMAGALMRTAFSPIVRESGDLSAGVFDARGRMLAQAVTGTPGHVNTMAVAVANFFDFFPPRTMRRGDIYLTNDPWLGAGHLNDFVLVQPCFAGGDGDGDSGDGAGDNRLIGFLSCTSHLVDIGGHCMGPDGGDVFDEGLYIPPMRLVDGRDGINDGAAGRGTNNAGRINPTLLALLKANSRIPQESEGDLYALVACCEVGARRLNDALNDFNLRDLGAVADAIVTASESATRARIAALPDGVYRNDMLTDGYDFEVLLRAALSIADGRIRLDLAGSSGRSRHGINVPLNYAAAYAAFGIKCAVAPDIPNNAGALAPIEVTAPPGCIVAARKPAPVNSRHIIGQLLPDLALGCLAHAMPGRLPAEGASTLWDLPLRNALDGGNALGDGNRGMPFSVELVHNGGTGARPAADGLSATGFPSGVMGSMVEITENVAPLRIVRRELRADSGGPGARRGGLGQVIELRSSEGAPMVLFGTVDRIRHPARGRDGGAAGAAGVLELASGAKLSGKGRFEIPGRDTLRALTPGGGGYGDPLARDPAAVAEDVADELVSVESARRDYGVALDAGGAVDEAQTARLRRELRRGELAAGGDVGDGETAAATVAETVSADGGETAAATVAETAAVAKPGVETTASTAPARPFPTDSRGRARIGVVVPVSNSNLEPDLALLRPRGVSLHFARVGGYDIDAVPDGDQMRQLAQESLDDIIDSLAACRVDVILYGCTSATLAHGRDFDRDLRRQIEARAGVPAVTAAGAVVEALRDLRAARIGLATPYTADLNRAAAAYLESCGIEVATAAGVDAALDNYQQGALTPAQVFALGLRADHAHAQAALLSCTDMRAVEVIDALEAALDKPVVTSNQALLYAALKRLNARPAAAEPLSAPPGFGRLLSAAAPAPAAGEETAESTDTVQLAASA